MWPTPCTFSVFTTLWKSQFRGHEAASNRRPSRVPLRSLFSFVSTELARGLTRCSSRSEVTSDTCNGSYCEKFRVTKVTFTPHGAASTIQLVVWQFWGRAAEASLTEKSRALFYVCRACSTARRCKSSTQPDGGEGLAKRKGEITLVARRGLKEAWSKDASL